MENNKRGDNMKEIVALLQEYYNNQFLTSEEIIDIVNTINNCFCDRDMMVDNISNKYIIIYFRRETYAISFRKLP